MYIIHIGAILAIWMGMYYPGLDLVLASLYLVLLWKEGSYTWQRLGSRLQQVLIAIIWQFPGLFMALSLLSGLDQLTEFAYYFVFMLELWQTPVLPWLSLLPPWMPWGWPAYYLLMFGSVPFFMILYVLPALTGKRVPARIPGQS